MLEGVEAVRYATERDAALCAEGCGAVADRVGDREGRHGGKKEERRKNVCTMTHFVCILSLE